MPLDHLTTTILDAVRDGVVVADESNRVIHANSQAQLLLRKRSNEIVGQDVMQVIPNLAGSTAEAQLSRAIADKTLAAFEHFSSSVYLWYEVRVVPVGDRVTLIIRDITDRNRMIQSEAVREALRQVLQQAPIAITIFRGREHRFELVNDYARRLIGDRDVEGRTVRSVFPELESQGLIKILDDAFASGEPWQAKELPIAFDRTGEGKLTESKFNVTYQPFLEVDGRVAGIIALSVEIE